MDLNFIKLNCNSLYYWMNIASCLITLIVLCSALFVTEPNLDSSLTGITLCSIQILCCQPDIIDKVSFSVEVLQYGDCFPAQIVLSKPWSPLNHHKLYMVHCLYNTVICWRVWVRSYDSRLTGDLLVDASGELLVAWHNTKLCIQTTSTGIFLGYVTIYTLQYHFHLINLLLHHLHHYHQKYHSQQY